MKPNISNKRKLQPMVMLRALLCCGLLGAGVASQAATITWQSASNITLNSFGQLSATPGSTTDPYLGGTTKYAYTWGASSPYNAVPGELLFVKTNIVNGSTPEGNLTVSGFSGINSESSFFGVYANLPANYKNCLANAATNSSGAMCTVTLSNLTFGTSYAVQVWVNDSTGTTRTNLYATVANTVGNGGAGVDLLYNNGYGNYLTSGGAVGQCVVGTFTADTNYQAFTMEGKVLSGSGASTILNAIQLRDLTPSAANAPVYINPVPGTNYMGAQNILVVGESGSTVYYTTDGSTPTTSSPSGAVGSGYALVNIPAGFTTTNKAVSDAPAKFKTLLSAQTDGIYTTTNSGTATWITAGGGVFSNVVNWASFVPFGPNTVADFSTVSLTGTAWVTNEVTRTNGSLLFDDQSGNHNAWVLTNNTINLNNNLTTPVISNNVPVKIRSTLQGVHGFVKTGSGALTVYSAYTLGGSGAGNVENGMLELGASTLGGVPAIYLGTANSGSATTTFRLAPVTSSNGTAGLFPNLIISSAAPNSTAVIDGSPNSTSWGNLNAPIVLQGGRSVTFTNSGAFFYVAARNISGNGDVIVAAPNYAGRIVLNPTNATLGIPLPINNTWVGNLRITSGALQTSYGLGTTFPSGDAIPDTDDVIMSANTILALGARETFGALIGDATAIVGESFTINGTSFNMTLGANNSNGVFNGTIRLSDVGAYANANMPLQITKIGTGTQTFNGACSNTAPTLVGGGALIINSAYFASPVTVSNNATLGGSGIITNNVDIQAGGTLSPGASIGTLTISSNLTLAGNLTIEVDKSLAPAQTNDYMVVGGALTNTGVGTVTVTNLNLGQPFAGGDKFTLFSQPLGNGSAMTISPASPGAGLAWANNLAVDGSIGVVNTNPAPITVSVSGSTLTLTWPADHLGWKLQMQTNTLDTGITTGGWVTIPGTDLVTTTNISIIQVNPAVFFRMTYP